MTKDELIAFLSQPPASFVWSRSEDGTRTIGTSEGIVLDLLDERVEAINANGSITRSGPARAEIVALFPPDRPDVAARSGTLMQLILLALRPEWGSASAWLATCMRAAARSKVNWYENPNITRRVTFKFDRLRSRATMRIDNPWTSAPS